MGRTPFIKGTCRPTASLQPAINTSRSMPKLPHFLLPLSRFVAAVLHNPLDASEFIAPNLDHANVVRNAVLCQPPLDIGHRMCSLLVQLSHRQLNVLQLFLNQPSALGSARVFACKLEDTLLRVPIAARISYLCRASAHCISHSLNHVAACRHTFCLILAQLESVRPAVPVVAPARHRRNKSETARWSCVTMAPHTRAPQPSLRCTARRATVIVPDTAETLLDLNTFVLQRLDGEAPQHCLEWNLA